MNPLSLIPPPYASIARVALPILIVAGAYVGGDLHGSHTATARLTAKYQPRMQHAADVMALSTERIRSARAQALAADLANARRVEAAQDHASQETANALEAQLAVARAAATDHARRMRDGAEGGAAGGSGGVAGVSAASGPAGGAAPADQAAVMASDDVACAEGVTIAAGWQDWWRAVAAVQRYNQP